MSLSLTDGTPSPPGRGGGSGGVGVGGGHHLISGFRKHRAYTQSISCLRKQPFETHLLAAPSGTVEDTSEGRRRSTKEPGSQRAPSTVRASVDQNKIPGI